MSARRNLGAFPAQRNPAPLKGCQGHPDSHQQRGISQRCTSRGSSKGVWLRETNREEPKLLSSLWPNVHILGGCRLQKTGSGDQDQSRGSSTAAGHQSSWWSGTTRCLGLEVLVPLWISLPRVLSLQPHQQGLPFCWLLLLQ